jgi:uncharacterized membrane protein YtjA (UPF0391 family)
MLRAAIVFFIVALVAMFFGANNIAGVSADLGRTLLWVFVVLAIISLVASVVTGRRGPGVLGVMLALMFGFSFSLPQKAHADESAGQKVNDAAHDTTTTAKKKSRHAKKEVRDATGNHSVKEDVKDSAKDAKDDVSNSADKAKDH